MFELRSWAGKRETLFIIWDFNRISGLNLLHVKRRIKCFLLCRIMKHSMEHVNCTQHKMMLAVLWFLVFGKFNLTQSLITFWKAIQRTIISLSQPKQRSFEIKFLEENGKWGEAIFHQHLSKRINDKKLLWLMINLSPTSSIIATIRQSTARRSTWKIV